MERHDVATHRRKPAIGRPRRLRVAAALGAVCAIGVAACSSSGSTQSAADSKSPNYGVLTISLSSFAIHSALPAIAAASDCFTKAGFSSVNFVQTGSASTDLGSLNQGRVDLTLDSLVDVIKAVSSGETNLVSIGTPYAGLESYVMVSNSVAAKIPAGASTTAKIQALKGLKIGVSAIGAYDYTYAWNTLKAGGLNPATAATLVSFGTESNEYAALVAGRIDAAVYSQPLVAETVDQHQGAILITPAEAAAMPGLVLDLDHGSLNANKAAVTSDPAKYAAVMKALSCAGQVMLSDPTKAETLARQDAGGAKVSTAIWSSVWSSAVAPNTGPLWLATNEKFQMSTSNIQRAIEFAGVKNVTPADVYDGTPANDAS